MTNNDWKRVIRLVVTILAIAAAVIPAALALGLAVRVFLWAASLQVLEEWGERGSLAPLVTGAQYGRGASVLLIRTLSAF